MTTGHVLGYARVSTEKQNLDRQLDTLNAEGVDRIFTDKMSGKRNDRPGFAELLDYARAGDTIVVASLDRLGRSLSGIIATVAELKERGIHLRSIKESIDTSTAVGQMLLGIFGSLAEYEHSLIAERAEEAREAARKRGKQTGRPRALTPSQVRQARTLRDAGETIVDIMASLGCSRATLYRALQQEPATTG